MTNDYGAEIATRTDTIEGTWSLGGETYNLEVKDAKYKTLRLLQEYATLAQSIDGVGTDPTEEELESIEEQAENLENFPWEDDNSNVDFVKSIFDEKLINPDIDADEANARAISAILQGIINAWQEGESVKAAKEEMPVEGNR